MSVRAKGSGAEIENRPRFSAAPPVNEDNAARATREFVGRIIESIFYSHMPGHAGGAVLDVGQVARGTAREEADKKHRELVAAEIRANFMGLEPERIREEWIPSIVDELIAVRAATESSTSSILRHIEDIETILAGSDEDAHTKRIRAALTTIVENCSFQDITGQRIGKIINLLEYIEGLMDGLLGVLGEEISAQRYEQFLKRFKNKVDPGEKLEGPQLFGPGTTQEEIDKLFD